MDIIFDKSLHVNRTWLLSFSFVDVQPISITMHLTDEEAKTLAKALREKGF
jgi:hypothetical protein